MSEIKLFDIVRTPAGNIAVVDMIGVRGNVSLNFVRGHLPDTHCKNAWWQKDNEYLKDPMYNIAKDSTMLLPYEGLTLLVRMNDVIDNLANEHK